MGAIARTGDTEHGTRLEVDEDVATGLRCKYLYLLAG